MHSLIFPDGCRIEKQWIGSIIFSEFLGVPCQISFESTEDVMIVAEGKMLKLPDIFFRKAGDNWAHADTLPSEPLACWNVHADAINAAIVAPSVPVIYGNGELTIGESEIALQLDIFGSAFFMLSGYEDAVVAQRDEHDRFPGVASIAYRQGYLERPIIDEYVEILWAAMKRLWPQAQRRKRTFSVNVSCDVDQPYHPGAHSFAQMLRHTIKKVTALSNFSGITQPAMNYLCGRSGNLEYDPYYSMVDWIMDVNEPEGNTVAFNFIPERTDPTYDGSISISDPAVTEMLKRIERRQHEIGLHCGYHCYKSVGRTQSGLAALRSVLSNEHIKQSVNGGRNHYLRWSLLTPSILNITDLHYDSTLGYADLAGFRAGTCNEYSMFDLVGRQPLRIKQRPLVCMEISLFVYMGYGISDAAYNKMKQLKDAARTVNGCFTLLWHNSSFSNQKAQELYRQLIRA